MNQESGKAFEKIISQLLKLMGYDIKDETTANSKEFDFIARHEKQTTYIEVKFYRSKEIPFSLLKKSANKLAFFLKSQNLGVGVIIVSSFVPEKAKLETIDKYGIYIWDRKLLLELFSLFSIELLEEFEQLLLSVQQDTQNFNSINDINLEEKQKDEIIPIIKSSIKTKQVSAPVNTGENHCKELSTIVCGKSGWSAYEKKCIEILKFLFTDDLTLWEEQAKTIDGLHRFDLICRIASKDEYWKSITSSFNTRFVLFEFKNYCDPIEQGQVYTTEKYLYNKALRSVGFIISRVGASENAIIAAKGALKEHGKLILILSNQDLCEMLKMKDNGLSPNDYLADLLDKWLISLSR